jgi:hypothetical protein
MAGEAVVFKRFCEARLKFSLILTHMLLPCKHKVIYQGNLFSRYRAFQCVGSLR